MEQTINFYIKKNVRNVTVYPEIKNVVTPCEEQKEIKNFWGKIIKHSVKGGYYYGGKYGLSIDEYCEAINSNDKIHYVKDENGVRSIYQKSYITVEVKKLDGHNTYSCRHYFDTYDEAIAVGKAIAKEMNLDSVINYI